MGCDNMRKDKPNITFDELYEKIITYITNEKESTF